MFAYKYFVVCVDKLSAEDNSIVHSELEIKRGLNNKILDVKLKKEDATTKKSKTPFYQQQTIVSEEFSKKDDAKKERIKLLEKSFNHKRSTFDFFVPAVISMSLKQGARSGQNPSW